MATTAGTNAGRCSSRSLTCSGRGSSGCRKWCQVSWATSKRHCRATAASARGAMKAGGARLRRCSFRARCLPWSTAGCSGSHPRRTGPRSAGTPPIAGSRPGRICAAARTGHGCWRSQPIGTIRARRRGSKPAGCSPAGSRRIGPKVRLWSCWAISTRRWRKPRSRRCWARWSMRVDCNVRSQCCRRAPPTGSGPPGGDPVSVITGSLSSLGSPLRAVHSRLGPGGGSSASVLRHAG